MKVICRFAQVNQQFRLSEFESLQSLYDNTSRLILFDPDKPFSIIECTSPESARLVLSRSSLMLYMMEWICGPESSLDGLLDKIKILNQEGFFETFRNSSFKFTVDAYGRSMEQLEQVSIINRFSFMSLDGPISLKSPQVTFVVGIYFCSKAEYFFGIRIDDTESLRKDIEHFSLKKRIYLGTTSMDPQLSFIMGNVGRVKPGDLVYDPFVGTGSLLYIAGYLGAFTIGSDIDGRQLRGTTKGKLPLGQSITSNLQQYGLDLTAGLVCDITQHPWRKAEWFNAIICDPPYGVRAGAKRIARTDYNRNVTPDLYNKLYPTTAPYEIDDLVEDLLAFSSQFIILNGRLVFWYPEEDETGDEGLHIIRSFPKLIYQHPSFKLLYAMPQKIQKMTRWLMVYEKIK